MKVEKYMRTVFNPLLQTDADGLELKREKTKDLRELITSLKATLEEVKTNLTVAVDKIAELRDKLKNQADLQITDDLTDTQRENRLARRADIRKRIDIQVTTKSRLTARRWLLRGRIKNVNARLAELRMKIGRIRNNRQAKRELIKRLGL